MKVTASELSGVRLIEPRIFRDARGYFFESWSEGRYVEAGLPGSFKQDNVSVSRRGVLRGLHFQSPVSQGKLVTVLEGEVFDVAVDLRLDSKTFGRWDGYTLSAENGRQLFVPEGFAHGFVALSERVIVAYKCTEYYRPASESTLLWSDPDVGIDWPIEEPILSDKDRAGSRLRDIPRDRLF